MYMSHGALTWKLAKSYPRFMATCTMSPEKGAKPKPNAKL